MLSFGCFVAEMALNFHHLVLVDVILQFCHHLEETVSCQCTIASQLYLLLLLHGEDADDFSMLLEIDYLEQGLFLRDYVRINVLNLGSDRV